MTKEKPKRFITKKARELANQLHKEEHKIIEGKLPDQHRWNEWYYLMAGGIFQKLFDKLDEVHVEIFNKVMDLEKRFYKLEKSIKEISKQQKYLWQTLEDLK